MLAPLSLAFLIYASMLWSPCSPVYRYDTEKRIRGKLQWMSRELTIDAETKVRSVQQYRDQYYKSLPYQMGDTIFEMRDSYKKMVRFYQGMDSNISYKHLDLYQNVRTLVKIHRMSLEIENKVIMIQRWKIKRDNRDEHRERMHAVMRSGINHEYDELEDVPLREVQVRERLARKAAVVTSPFRAPRRRAPTHPPALELGDQRKNKKWRPVRHVDFARRSL